MLQTMLHYLKADLSFALLVNLVLVAWLWTIPTIVLRLRRLPPGALGLALPGVVLLRREAAVEQVLRHELVHQRQMRRYTPLGVALLLGLHYGPGLLRQRKAGRISFLELWRCNPLEREANQGMLSRDPLPRLIGWRGKA